MEPSDAPRSLAGPEGAGAPPAAAAPQQAFRDDGAIEHADRLPAAERLLLDVATEVAEGRAAEAAGEGSGRVPRVALVDLAPEAAAAASARLAPSALAVVHDRLSDEHAARGAWGGEPSGLASALTGAQLVLYRLPPALEALDELAALAATHADPSVVLLGVGNNRHLNRSMNDVLGRSFHQVRASRGRGKFRVLIAEGPRSDVDRSRYPRQARIDDLDLAVRAHGGVFAGTRVDPGTRLLLGTRDRWPAPDASGAEDAIGSEASGPASDHAEAVIDLGCGTGILAAVLARAGHRRVIAVDESSAACASARATASANGLDAVITVRREDGLTGRPDRSARLIVANPPFHHGTAKDSTPTVAMIEDAARVLVPGGELWLVFNSHLPYLSSARRLGPTTVVSRDRSYLVTRTLTRISAS